MSSHEFTSTEAAMIAIYRQKAKDGPAIINRDQIFVQNESLSLDLDVIKINPYITREYSREYGTTDALTPSLILVQQAAIDDGRYITGYLGLIEKSDRKHYSTRFYYTQAKLHGYLLGGMYEAGVSENNLKRICCGHRFPDKSLMNQLAVTTETMKIKGDLPKTKYTCEFDGVPKDLQEKYIDTLISFIHLVHEGIFRIDPNIVSSQYQIEVFNGSPVGITSLVKQETASL
jgi:hypothetical protein